MIKLSDFLSIRRETAVDSTKGKIVYDALIEGLSEMQRRGVGRVILSIYESKPSKDLAGRWIDFGKESRYYPFEMLGTSETEMILGGKTYTVDALVSKNVGDQIDYVEPGVERTERIRIFPMLPKLIPEAELNYVTEIVSLHEESDLRNIGQHAEKNGWTYGSTSERIKSGIAEWDRKTLELMEKVGVNKSLQEIEERGCSSIDKVFYEMRQNIAQGDKK